MADTKDKDKMNDEYDLGADEFAPEYEQTGSESEVDSEPGLDFSDKEPAPEMSMGESSPMIKKLLTGVGVILGTAIVGVYFVYSERSNQLADQQGVPEQTEQKSITKLVQNTAEQKPLAQPPQEAMPATIPQALRPVEQPAVVVQTQATTSQTTTSEPTQPQNIQLEQLAQQVRNNKLTLDNVEVQIETLSTSMKKSINDLQATIDKKLSAPKEQIAKPVKVLKTKPIVKRPSQPKEVFGLKAVIPGRAWIESASGRSYTVTYGDSLPGLGRVNNIDVAMGRVVTSSGSVIVYGPGDY